MEMFVIRGGRPLAGRVAVGGAKNSALPIMAAALAAEGPSHLHSVPDLVDVTTLSHLLETLGVQVSRQDDGVLKLEAVAPQRCVAEYDLVRRMRASFCVLGPMLARRGRACVSLPGGCNIGDRPIDLHLKGLRALGADICIQNGYVVAEARRLRGANIYLGGPFGSTVTGTCNVMTAATLAEGVTTIEAAACEPEVLDLGCYLNRMGARITGLGTPFLKIEGVERLEGCEHQVIPDRIEAATLMIAVAMTRGRVELENVCLAHMTAVIEKLNEIGIRIEPSGPERGGTPGLGAELQRVTVSVPGRLQSADIIALPYPGLATDVQAQFTALLSAVSGISIVTDKVFPDRFLHAPELVRLGADIRREGNSAIINGTEKQSGACVMASDLRASAALVIAALAAEGESVIRRIYHLDRGYDRLDQKLNRLGADVRRLQDKPANMPARLVPAVIGVAHEFDTTAPARQGPKWLKRKTRRQRQSDLA